MDARKEQLGINEWIQLFSFSGCEYLCQVQAMPFLSIHQENKTPLRFIYHMLIRTSFFVLQCCKQKYFSQFISQYSYFHPILCNCCFPSMPPAHLLSLFCHAILLFGTLLYMVSEYFFPVVPSLHGPAQAPLLNTLWYCLPTFLLKNNRYVIVDR